MQPTVSIIVPCFNEERFIGALIENILRQDYPSGQIGIFIADGRSTDRTREIIEQYRLKNPQIRLIDNPDRFVPQGLNRCIEASDGEIVLRMDAHSEYPENYVSRLVEELIRLGADNTGGVWHMKPANDKTLALAIAAAQSSAFGTGNASYRSGGGQIRKVDTVPYGCFPRSLFGRIGKFDPQLLRNQDDEFNARIQEKGGSVYLVPDVIITYYARPKLKSLVRMFYQYGFFKPLVNQRLKRPATVRQFVPPVFVMFLLLGWTGALLHTLLLWPYLAITGIYLLASLAFTALAVVRSGNPRLAFYLPWLFFLQHVAYGTGYLAGVVNFTLLHRTVKNITSSR